MTAVRQVARRVLPALLALTCCFVLFELTPIDLWLQDQFFDFETGRWMVDRNNPLGRAVFYDGPKYVIYVVAFAAIVMLAGPARWRRRWALDRRMLGAALFTLATVPVLAGIGKRALDVFCPYEITRYDGDAPYVKVFESYSPDDRPSRRGGCFPAGHASGGFALMGFAWLRSSRRWRVAAIAVGLFAGWWMGLYQMLKGAHYLSHTVTTMLLAWLIAVLGRMWFRAAGGDRLTVARRVSAPHGWPGHDEPTLEALSRARLPGVGNAPPRRSGVEGDSSTGC